MAVALHGAFLALDASVPIPVLALLVPGTSPYRPLWVGLGVVARELMLLIHLSFRFAQAHRREVAGGGCTTRPSSSSAPRPSTA